jgi:alkaline phosphatase D
MPRSCALLSLVVAALPSLAPARESTKPLSRIAFGSCAHQDRPQPIWEAIVGTKPELFLFLGDNIYADTADMKVLRARYAKLAALPGYRKLRKTCPVLATWDDHDYGFNDSGSEYPKKRESQQVFLDFFGVPKDSPRRKRAGVYHAAVFGPAGKRVQVILLDTRYHRSPLKKGAGRRGGPYVPNTAPGATILGAEQWKWLAEQLRLPAEVRLIVSSIQVVAEDHGYEKWMNFPRERQRLFKLLADTKAAGVVFLSGDRHLAELSVMDGEVGYPLFDLTSSGLNMAAPGWRMPERNRHRVATMTSGNNFGMVRIDWDRPEPRLTLEARDEEGDVTIAQKLSLRRLQRRPLGPDLAAEAGKHVGKEWTVEMEVRSTGGTRTRVFLNSEENFRSARNLTVVLDRKALAAELARARIDDPQAHFAGKRVRVRGTVSLFRKRPQIVVKEMKQIVLVGK